MLQNDSVHLLFTQTFLFLTPYTAKYITIRPGEYEFKIRVGLSDHFCWCHRVGICPLCERGLILSLRMDEAVSALKNGI